MMLAQGGGGFLCLLLWGEVLGVEVANGTGRETPRREHTLPSAFYVSLHFSCVCVVPVYISFYMYVSSIMYMHVQMPM